MCVLFFFSIGPLLHAQSAIDSLALHSKVDSVLREIRTKKDLTVIKIYNDLFKDISNIGAWDIFYACEIDLYTIGSNHASFESVLPIIVRNAVLIPDSEIVLRAKTDYIIGYMHDQLGNIIQSLNAYKKANHAFAQLNDQKRLLGTFGNMGIIHTKLGAYTQAEASLKQALSIATSIRDTAELIRHYYNLAIAQFHNAKFEESKASLNQYQSLYPDNEGRYELKLAELTQKKGDLMTALRYTEDAHQKNSSAENPTMLPYIARVAGDILVDLNRHEVALERFQHAEKSLSLEEDKREKVKLYISMARAHLQDTNVERSLHYAHLALTTLLPEVKSKLITDLPDSRLLYPEKWFIEIFKLKGDCFRQQYDNKKDSTSLSLALAHYEYAIEQIEDIKLFYSDASAKYKLGSTPTAVFESAIATLEVLQDTGSDTSIMQQAFIIAQKFNAFILREHISERKTIDLLHIDEATKSLYYHTKDSLLELNYQLQQQYSDSLFTLSEALAKRYESLSHSINEEDSRFFELRRDLSVPSVSDIQNILPDDAGLIKYFFGQHFLYTFAIHRKGFVFRKTGYDENTIGRINLFRNLLGNYSKSDTNEKTFIETSQELYSTMVADIISELPVSVNKLFIVPDGPLSKIPFEALMFEAAEDWNQPKNFLLTKYDISYLYFCKQLLQKTDDFIHDKFISFGLEYDQYTLGFLSQSKRDTVGPGLNLRSDHFSPLLFADDEARELASHFDGISFLNKMATKRTFLNEASKAGILHISAHSYLDLDRPENSAIIFSKERSDHDHLLTLHDIYGLEMDCQLVTLSACNTSFGKSKRGEGIISISRAFNQAGCNSVVGSFWSVPDEVSKTIMSLFYENLKKGMDKDAALRATKLEYLTNDEVSTPAYRSPNYWASWVVYGDVEALQSKSSVASVEIVILISFLVIGLVGWLSWSRYRS